jgi:hypothetical protein
MIYFFFLQIRKETICTTINSVTRSYFVLCLLKTTGMIVEALKKKKIRPDIRQKVSGASLSMNSVADPDPVVS